MRKIYHTHHTTMRVCICAMCRGFVWYWCGMFLNDEWCMLVVTLKKEAHTSAVNLIKMYRRSARGSNILITFVKARIWVL